MNRAEREARRALIQWRSWILTEDLRHSADVGPFRLQVLRSWEYDEGPSWTVLLGHDGELGPVLAGAELPLMAAEEDAKHAAESALIELAHDLEALLDGPAGASVRTLDQPWAAALFGRTELLVESWNTREYLARVGPLRLLTYELGRKGWTWTIDGEHPYGSANFGGTIADSQELAIVSMHALLADHQAVTRKLAWIL